MSNPPPAPASLWQPRAAMIFAAGKGVRMMPLTATMPKPMLSVAGQPLLGHALDRVAAVGIDRVVVNAHHCPQVIAQYLPTRTTPTDLRLSHETDLLETGGGVKLALQRGLLPADAPFVAVNADILWTDGPHPAIGRLTELWNRLGPHADVLLLLIPREKAWGHDSANGDYALAEDGRLTRLSNPDAPYVYAGVQIVRPGLYESRQAGERFSNLEIFDAAQARGRLFGLVHDGGWYHFSSPPALDRFAAEHPRP